MRNRTQLPAWGLGVWHWMLLWLFAFLFGCDSRPQPPLRVGLFPWAGYDPIVLARDLGYFEQRPIQVVDFASATQGLRAFRNGAIDAAFLTLDETILLAQGLPDVRVIVAVDYSNGADVLLGQKEIASLQDLRGKRIGYESSALGAYMLSRALEHAGLQAADVKPVSAQIDEHEKVFPERQVDAVVTFEPIRSHLLAEGAKVLFDSSQIPGEIIDVLVIKQSHLKDHPDIVDALVKGWFHALKYMRDNPEDARRRLGTRLKLTPPQVVDAYSRIKLLDPSENRDLLTTSPPKLVHSAQRLANHMLAHKLLSGPIQVAALLDPGPLSRVTVE